MAMPGRQQEIHAERDRKLEAARQATADSSSASRLTFSSRSLGVVLPVVGPSNGTSPRVGTLNFRLCRPSTHHSRAFARFTAKWRRTANFQLRKRRRELRRRNVRPGPAAIAATSS